MLARANRGNYDIMKLRGSAIRSDLLRFPSLLPFMSPALSYSPRFLSLSLYLSQSASPLFSSSSGASLVFLLYLTCILTFTATFFFFSLTTFVTTHAVCVKRSSVEVPSVNVFVCSHSSLREKN